MSRSQFLKEQEQHVQECWGKTAFEADAPIEFDPNNKKKFFVTFPFPYMNGRLHLGHVFSMLKADVMARHYRTKGYNVLFPFGYHGTGIPITAAANKLAEEISTNCVGKQYDTMKKMDIDESDIKKFSDPRFWLEYFPKTASEVDLLALGCAIDHRRSFITTNLNHYFDSFVCWQFKKLKEMGYLNFGKKMVIYSEKDSQPCSDADRSIGEGVEIKQYKVAPIFIEGKSYMATFQPDAPVDSFVISEGLQLFECMIIDQSMLPAEVKWPKYFYKNYVHQNPEDMVCTYIRDKDQIENPNLPVTSKWNHASGIYTSNPNFAWMSYFEPETEVISRSGDKCIVAKTDQWYILYDHPEWQKKVYEHVSTKVKFTDPIVKDLMLDTIKNSHPWPFSRTVGMGTRIPFDESYLIDSLSDSTIYMAYYTVAHLVSQIPKESMSDDVWNSIFFGEETEISKLYPELFKLMRNEFLYWYPMDLRVSGKDLITNHLTMMFFNHMAIFGPELMPKAVYANGHILVNGEKMSKNKGNFITLKQAVDKHGADVTRFVTATAGDDTNDGSFNDVEIDPAVLSMYAEIQNWSKFSFSNMRTGQLEFIDHLQMIKLNSIINKVGKSYDEMKFRDVIKFGFYEIQSVRNKYPNPHLDIFKLFLQAELAMVAPIIPHWAESMSKKYGIPIEWPSINIDSKYDNAKSEWLDVYGQIIMSKLMTKYKKYKKLSKKIVCHITINNDVQKFLDQILKFNTADKDQRKKLLENFSDKKEITTVIELFTHMDKYNDQFSKEEMAKWLSDNNKEILESYLNIQLPELEMIISYNGSAKGDPLNPEFKFV